MTETETKWAERVREWRDSGKGAEEFAAGQPYKASTLRWWGTEVRRRAEARTGRREGRGRKRTESIAMARVVRRRTHPRTSGVDLMGGGGVVVEVSGARVTVARGFDAEVLSAVVRILAGAR